MRRKYRIVWLSVNDSRPIQTACATMNDVGLSVCDPRKAATLAGGKHDLVIVDLRSNTSLDLIEIGRNFRTNSGAAVVFVVSDDSLSEVSRIDAAEPNGILVDPLSPVQCRLVIGAALRSRPPVHRGDAAVTKPLAGVTLLAPLTRRETDILDLFVTGHRVKSIARLSFISEGTVRAHLKAVFRKLNVRSQSELMEHLLKTKGTRRGD